jgi:hypothetical protein
VKTGTVDRGTAELAVRELVNGTPMSRIASDLGIDQASLDLFARHFGWPASLRRLRGAAKSIDSGSGAFALAGAPDLAAAEPAAQSVAEPAGESAAWGQEAPAAAVGVVTSVGDDFDAPVQDLLDAYRVAQLIDLTPGRSTTLRMPLGRFVDADGRETVLGYAVVDVELDRDGVLAALEGQDIGVGPVTCRVTSELAPEGEAAIRALAAQLPPVPEAAGAGGAVHGRRLR